MPPREHDDLCVFVLDRDTGTVGADQASAFKARSEVPVPVADVPIATNIDSTIEPVQVPTPGNLLRYILCMIVNFIVLLLGVNWFLAFFGLALKPVGDLNSVELRVKKLKEKKRKLEEVGQVTEEDSQHPNFKRAKSDEASDMSTSVTESVIGNVKKMGDGEKAKAIAEFQNRLWNLEPDINFGSEEQLKGDVAEESNDLALVVGNEVDAFGDGDPLNNGKVLLKKVINPSKSFDDVLNMSGDVSDTPTGDEAFDAVSDTVIEMDLKLCSMDQEVDVALNEVILGVSSNDISVAGVDCVLRDDAIIGCVEGEIEECQMLEKLSESESNKCLPLIDSDNYSSIHIGEVVGLQPMDSHVEDDSLIMEEKDATSAVVDKAQTDEESVVKDTVACKLDYPVVVKPDYSVQHKPDYPLQEKPDYAVIEKPDYQVLMKPDYQVVGKPDYQVQEKLDYPLQKKPDYQVVEKPDYPVKEKLNYQVVGKPEYPVLYTVEKLDDLIFEELVEEEVESEEDLKNSEKNDGDVMQDLVSDESLAQDITDPELVDKLIYDEISFKDKSDEKRVEIQIGSAEKTAALIKSDVMENSNIGHCEENPSAECVEEDVLEKGGRRGSVGAKGKGGGNKSGGKKKKKRKIL